MVLDTVFFDRLVKTMQTNHFMVSSNRETLKVTEAWVAFGDQLLNQCKSILHAAKADEEREAVFEQINEIMNESFDQEMFELSFQKTIDKIREFDKELLINDDEDELE